MNLDDYLLETEYAARALLDAIWHEFEEVERLRQNVARRERQVTAEYAAAEAIMDNAEDSDDVMLGVGRHWDNYFGADQQRNHRQLELDELIATREARTFALGALAGALLHIAKQGLSSAFGPYAEWPNGRLVGRQPLKDVIRGGRNQAEHWEEGQIRNAETRACSEHLHADFGAPFDHYADTNMAMPVMQVLGWLTYAHFVADLRTFALAARHD